MLQVPALSLVTPQLTCAGTVQGMLQTLFPPVLDLLSSPDSDVALAAVPLLGSYINKLKLTLKRNNNVLPEARRCLSAGLAQADSSPDPVPCRQRAIPQPALVVVQARPLHAVQPLRPRDPRNAPAQGQRQQLVAIMRSLAASARYPADLCADGTVPEDVMQVSRVWLAFQPQGPAARKAPHSMLPSSWHNSRDCRRLQSAAWFTAIPAGCLTAASPLVHMQNQSSGCRLSRSAGWTCLCSCAMRRASPQPTPTASPACSCS